MLLSLCELSQSPESGCYFAGLQLSFVPNLEACRCLLLICYASFDILFTFLPDMQRKHLHQSVSFMACVVRVSGLPSSLHCWGDGVYSAPQKCAPQTLVHQKKSICIVNLNYNLKITNHHKIYEVVNCKL